MEARYSYMGQRGLPDFSRFQGSKVEPSYSVKNTKGNGTSCELSLFYSGSVRARQGSCWCCSFAIEVIPRTGLGSNVYHYTTPTAPRYLCN